MKAHARKNPTPRTWRRTTSGSVMISARLPVDLANKLRAYVDDTSATTTDVVIAALNLYFDGKGGTEGGNG